MALQLGCYMNMRRRRKLRGLLILAIQRANANRGNHRETRLRSLDRNN